MRKKEIEFDIYLKKNNQESMIQKVEDKEQTVYRAGYKIKEETLLFFITLNDTAYSSVLCRLGTLKNELKRVEALEMTNFLNFKYIPAKFTLDSENNLDFRIDIIATDDEFNPEMAVQVPLNVLQAIEQDYEKITDVLNN